MGIYPIGGILTVRNSKVSQMFFCLFLCSNFLHMKTTRTTFCETWKFRTERIQGLKLESELWYLTLTPPPAAKCPVTWQEVQSDGSLSGFNPLTDSAQAIFCFFHASRRIKGGRQWVNERMFIYIYMMCIYIYIFQFYISYFKSESPAYPINAANRVL